MRFYLSGNLLRFSDYDRQIDVEGDTVYAGLLGLIERYPDLQPVLLDSDQQVRRVHQIFLNDELIKPEHIRTRVSPDSEVTILTALVGG